MIIPKKWLPRPLAIFTWNRGDDQKELHLIIFFFNKFFSLFIFFSVIFHVISVWRNHLKNPNGSNMKFPLNRVSAILSNDVGGDFRTFFSTVLKSPNGWTRTDRAPVKHFSISDNSIDIPSEPVMSKTENCKGLQLERRQ